MTDLTIEIQSLCLLVLAGFTIVQVFINRNHRESIKLLAGRIDILKEFIDNINDHMSEALKK